MNVNPCTNTLARSIPRSRARRRNAPSLARVLAAKVEALALRVTKPPMSSSVIPLVAMHRKRSTENNSLNPSLAPRARSSARDGDGAPRAVPDGTLGRANAAGSPLDRRKGPIASICACAPNEHARGIVPNGTRSRYAPRERRVHRAVGEK